MFGAAFNGSWLEQSTTTPYPGAPTYDCPSLFGPNCNSNSVLPRWHHTLRVNWETPWRKLLLSANWRFIGATGFDNDSTQPSLRFSPFGGFDSVIRRIPNYSYLDLSGTYDLLGRQQFVGFTAKF